MNLTYLDWDSKKFGYEVFRVNLDEDLSNIGSLPEIARNNNAQLMYIYSMPNKEVMSKLGKLGAILVDKKTTYVMDLSESFKKYKKSDKIYSYKLSNFSDKLLSLAYQAGIYSRFNVDPNFSNDEYNLLYRVWLKKSLKRENAFEVYVYKEEEELGFVTIGKKDLNADIGLIAVDEKQRGKGIGKLLMNSAFKRSLDEGYKKIEVTTQGDNLGACRFYESIGFSVKSVINIHHLWIDKRHF